MSSDGSTPQEAVIESEEPASPPAPACAAEAQAAAPVTNVLLPPGAGVGEEDRLPPPVLAFLDAQVSEADTAAGEGWLTQTRDRLRVALRGYELQADVIGSRLTPNAALVRFRGSDNLNRFRCGRKQDVLLTSHGLDVIGVLPGRGEVIVMVAREQRASPSLAELWRKREFSSSAPEKNTSFLLGEREADETLLYLNLGGAFGGQPQHGPHTLIAGETGSGKGVMTRNLILDICATNSPRNARIRMIDPKSGGDYPWISKLPHLDGGLVTTQDEAKEALKELVAEMDARYAQITQVTSNIDHYNAKVEPEKRLPRIYLFHDELGDWMADIDRSDYREAVESYVARLGMKARAAGIHLFLITQRPDKDALPGPIKANMNNKVCLRVSSATNSRIVLDENGAERLLGMGHFAAKLANERPSNQSSLIYAQAPFLEDDLGFDLAVAISEYWKGR